MYLLTHSGIFNCQQFEQIDCFGESIIGISLLNPTGITLYNVDDAYKYHDIELDHSDKHELLDLVFASLFINLEGKKASCKIADLELESIKILKERHPEKFGK